MSEPESRLSILDPEALKRLCLLYQEIWHAYQCRTERAKSSVDASTLKGMIAWRVLQEAEAGECDPAVIKERALAGL